MLCVVIDGFKRDRHFALPGQEIDLPEEEFEAMRKAGAVRAAGEVLREKEAEEDLIRGILMDHIQATEKTWRDPSKEEIQQGLHIGAERLRGQLAAQRRGQEEWEQALAEREARRLAHQQAKEQAEIQRLNRGLDRHKKRTGV